MSAPARPSRLAFLLFDYFPFGGLQRDCIAIAKLCAQRGHDVTVLTRTWRGERIPELNVKVFGRKGFSNPTRNRHWLRQLETELPAQKFDCVIGFNKLPGLDVYYGADPCYMAKAHALKSFWFRWRRRYRHYVELESSVFARGNRTELLMLTPRDIPQYRHCYDTEPERFHVLPPNATRRSFTEEQRVATRARMRSAQGWGADEQLVLFVGSDFNRKGLDRAISAFASLDAQSRAHLVVIGDRAPGKFAKLAESLGVGERVHFLGGRHDVPDWMLAADVMIHPALVETAGIVLLEAVTFGLPVIATDACGYAPHISSAGGIVLPAPFDQERCNRSLAELLEPQINAAARARALDYAAREDLYSCHQRVVEIIERVLVSKSAR